MNSVGNKTARNALFGALAGYGIRRIYDKFNAKKMLNDYHEEGVIPKKKSMLLAITLSSFFGSIGLLYSSPRTALPLMIVDIPLMTLILTSLLLRPIVIFLAIASVISHNAMIDKLFSEYGGGYE